MPACKYLDNGCCAVCLAQQLAASASLPALVGSPQHAVQGVGGRADSQPSWESSPPGSPDGQYGEDAQTAAANGGTFFGAEDPSDDEQHGEASDGDADEQSEGEAQEESGDEQDEQSDREQGEQSEGEQEGQSGGAASEEQSDAEPDGQQLDDQE